MERKNIGTLTGNDVLPCVSARRITLPLPFTVIFTTRRDTLCMIVERSRRGCIILFRRTIYISLCICDICNISHIVAPCFSADAAYFPTRLLNDENPIQRYWNTLIHMYTHYHSYSDNVADL